MLAGMETPQQSSRRRRTPSDAEVPSLLAEIAKSKQSIAGFARSHGIAPWKLYEARRKRRTKAAPPISFDPVRVVDPSVTPLLVELNHASGHRLLVPAGFDPATLRSLLEVLRAC
jgi:hypothetical protein